MFSSTRRSICELLTYIVSRQPLRYMSIMSKEAGNDKQLSRDKFSVWRCHAVAKEQHGTKRRFEQFEHLSFSTFYFLRIPIRAVVLILRGYYFVLLDIWGSEEHRFSLPNDESVRDGRL